MKSLKVSLCQMTSVDSEEANLLQMKDLVSKATATGSRDLICFPENCLYMRVKEGAKIPGVESGSSSFSELQALAKKTNSNLHLGSVPLKENGKLQNASIFITCAGELRVSYVKIHLFDIQLQGREPVRESDVFSYGEKSAVLDIDGWNVGQTICYDLRFAELFSQYAALGCQVIVVPSAFLVETGRHHWEVLLRARAIESQAYVLAAAQAGTHVSVDEKYSGVRRETYGHSLIVGPWGEILAQGSANSPEVLNMDLDPAQVEKVRSQIPMSSHRRLHKRR